MIQNDRKTLQRMRLETRPHSTPPIATAWDGSSPDAPLERVRPERLMNKCHKSNEIHGLDAAAQSVTMNGQEHAADLSGMTGGGSGNDAALLRSHRLGCGMWGEHPGCEREGITFGADAVKQHEAAFSTFFGSRPSFAYPSGRRAVRRGITELPQ
jgi:hypothetical protein